LNDSLLIGMHCSTHGESVSAVLINSRQHSMDLLHARQTPYPSAIRQTLAQLIDEGRRLDHNLASLLDDNLGRFCARVAQDLVREAGMEMRDIRVIGFDGQEIFQLAAERKSISTRLGNGKIVAKNTGTVVVADFYHETMAHGKTTASLTPLFHRHVFSSEDEHRAVLSVGATAGLTLLPAQGTFSFRHCGDGTNLLDTWAGRHLNHDPDRHGEWARKGVLDPHLLEQLTQSRRLGLEAGEHFRPRRELLEILQEIVRPLALRPVDVQATLIELIAGRVTLPLLGGSSPKRLLVSAEGAKNTCLMRKIAALLPDTVVETSARFGAEPVWAGCMSFAWLAEQRLAEKSHDIEPLTGAGAPVLLGEIFLPPG
jgi:anhydro-N-acetylmuramic acid kinase